MVKVVQAYNFPYQTTHAAATDITATTLIDGNKLAVGCMGNFIEIYSLEKKSKLKSEELDENTVQIIDDRTATQSKKTKDAQISFEDESFDNIGNIETNEEQTPTKSILPTIGTVIDIIYCNVKQYLVTLEIDCNYNETRSVEQKKVRIFTNYWKFPEEELCEIPTTPRIASRITPNSDINKSIDLIELPMVQTPEIIACCQASGNIIVGSKDKIFLFELLNCMHETPKFTYIDFVPFSFYVSLNFIPTKLNFVENVIACFNKNYAVIFKIIDIPGADTEDDSGSVINSHISKTSLPSSSNSFETDSLETSARPHGIENVVDFAVAQKANSVCGREFEFKIKSQWEKADTISYNKRDFDDRPKRTNSIKIKLINMSSVNSAPIQQQLHCDNNVQYDIKKLLQVCLSKSDETVNSSLRFKSMDLKPIYQEFVSIGPSEYWDRKHLMKSNSYRFCVGFSFLIATYVDGYLYQFCNKGKWYNENEKPVAIYNFTAPILSVYIDRFAIVAVTTESVEVHASRVGHKLYANRYEYPTISKLYPEESSPDVNAPVTVIGLSSFMNVQFVCFDSLNLVLISGIPDKKLTSNEWTIYSLKVPSAKDVVNDLENIAETYRDSSPDFYFELMEEAHAILRMVNTINLNNHRKLYYPLTDEFDKNCRKLADFSIRSKKKEIYMQATGFYKMCKTELDEIYCDFFSSENYKVPEFTQAGSAGLLYTLKNFILSIGTNKTKAAYLNKMIKSVFAHTPQDDMFLGNYDVKLGIEILYIFATYTPNDIPMVMLSSPIFMDIVDKELVQYLAKKCEMTSDELLLLAVCTARKSKLTLSRQIIESMSRKSLALSLIAYKNVLFDDNYNQEYPELSTFSDLAEDVLFCTDSSYLIEGLSDALISLLCIQRTLSLRFIVPLFMNYFATQIGHKGYRKSQNVLSNVLQSYFYNYFDICDMGRPKSKISEDLSTTNIATTTKSLSTDDADYGIVSGEYVLTSGNISCNVNQNRTKDEDSYTKTRQENNRPEMLINKQSVDDIWEEVSNSISKNNDSIFMNVPFVCDSTAIGCSSYFQTVVNALKILFRMYLGQLKQLSDKIQLTTKSEMHRDKSIIYLSQNKNSTILQHVQNVPNYIKNDDFLVPTNANDLLPKYNDPNIAMDYYDHNVFIRPIPCLEYRPAYLNQMEPFSEKSFRQNDNGTWTFVEWENEAVVLILKIQSLLCCHKTDPVIVEELLSFIEQQTAHLIGIDSILTILLPKPLAMDYIIAVKPEIMWIYGKSQRLQPKQWEIFLKKILEQKDNIPNWKIHLNSILNNLVAEKPFEELLQCFPTDVVTKNTSLIEQDPNLPERPVVMDNIDESNAFEVILRQAVAKQRSLALRSMIESTGTQLFDAAGTISQ